MSIRCVPGENSIQFLGGATNLQQGLNWIGKLRFWFQEHKLTHYESPYRNSYAIVAAIDDYTRSKDPNHRKPTGYPDLGFMVPQARQLTNLLQTVGFPGGNIITFFEQDATSDNINNALLRFWKAKNALVCDRLFFYFGGHGHLRHARANSFSTRFLR